MHALVLSQNFGRYLTIFFWMSNGVLFVVYIKDLFFLFLDLIGPEEKQAKRKREETSAQASKRRKLDK